MTVGVVLNVVALVVVAAYLLRQAYPATEAVRVRNALLLEPSTDDDFSWTPANVPNDFRLERRARGPEFVGVVRALGIDRLADDWSKALALAGHLTEHAAEDEDDAGPVHSDLLTTYRRIREGHGYCADFVKVYLALAHAAGLVGAAMGVLVRRVRRPRPHVRRGLRSAAQRSGSSSTCSTTSTPSPYPTGNR